MTCRRRRIVGWICLALVLCLLVLAFAAIMVLPGRWYLFFQRHRIYSSLSLEKLSTSEVRESVTLEELRKDPRVRFTNALMLVNAEHPLPEDYQPSITDYKGIEMHPDAVEGYAALAARVEKLTGDRLLVVDDFRTREEQEAIAKDSEEGIAAIPGCSEHEAGLALDVCVKGYGGQSFLKTWAGIYTNLFCQNYGFIIRYPAEKEDVTGISYEPWHLRYVGETHARLMAESGLTLEEYVESLVPGVWYRTGNTLLCRASATGIALPAGWSLCEISPDNLGYYVITLHME